MTETDLDTLRESRHVQRWLAAVNPLTEGERDERLELIHAFCRYTGSTPEELVTSCLRTTKEGRTAISTKGRRAAQALIDSFVEERGLSGHEAIVLGNKVRSFLIHNGVYLQGRASIR